MTPRHRKNRAYTLSLVPDDGRRHTLTLLKGPAALFAVIGVLFSLFLIGTTAFALLQTPLADMLPGIALPRQQKQLITQQVGRVDSLVSEIEKMHAFSEEMESVLFLGEAIAGARTDAQAVRRQGNAPSGVLPGAVHRENERRPAVSGRLVTGPVLQPFRPSESHYGVDVAFSTNEPVGAIADGSVIFAGWTQDAGYTMILDHGEYTVFYKHCSRLLKRGGEQVKLGEVVALSGNTGEASSGPHLHFEVWKDGIPVDPQKYFTF